MALADPEVGDAALQDSVESEELARHARIFGQLQLNDPLHHLLSYRTHNELTTWHDGALIGLLEEGRYLAKLREQGVKVVRAEELGKIDYVVVVGNPPWPGGVAQLNMLARLRGLRSAAGSSRQKPKNLLIAEHKTVSESLSLSSRVTFDSSLRPVYQIQLTGAQSKDAQVLSLSFAKRSDVHGLIPHPYIPSVKGKTSTISVGDPVLQFSEIPPLYQPWVVPIKELGPAWSLIEDSAANGTTYSNPNTLTCANNWRPKCSSNINLLNLHSTSPWSQAAARGESIIINAMKDIAGSNVDLNEIQPLGGDICINEKLIELKVATVHDMVSGYTRFQIPTTVAGEEEQRENVFRRSPFNPSRCYHYLASFNEDKRYGYFVPRSRLITGTAREPQKDPTYGWHVDIPTKDISEFRVRMDSALGHSITTIMKRYPDPLLPAPVMPKIPRAEKAPSKVAIGATRMTMPWHAFAFWLVENINRYFAAIRRGLLFPLLVDHLVGNSLLTDWKWSEADYKKFQESNRLPTGLGLPEISPYKPGVKVRLLDASTQRGAGSSSDRTLRYLRTQKAPAGFNEFPSLCILDSFGRSFGHDLVSLAIVPSEFVQMSSKGQYPVEVRLQDKLKFAQFEAHENALGITLGHHLLSFLTDFEGTCLPWTKTQSPTNNGYGPPLHVKTKEIYFTTVRDVHQMQQTGQGKQPLKTKMHGKLTFAQFEAHENDLGVTLGHHLLSFLTDFEGTNLPWTKTRSLNRNGYGPQLHIKTKKPYFTTVLEVLQLQVDRGIGLSGDADDEDDDEGEDEL